MHTVLSTGTRPRRQGGVLGRTGNRIARWTAVALSSMLIASCVGSPPTDPTPPSGQAPSNAGLRRDPALVALSIMPPGNGNLTGHTAAFSDDQRQRYDDLEDPVAAGSLTDADLGTYFLDGRLGTGSITRVDHPSPDVRVEWDDHGVPHVIGKTAAGVAYGAGWAVAESRLIIAELGRLLGRAGTLELGGPDIPTAIAKLGVLPRINYTDAELLGGLDAEVAAAGADGPRILEALDGFVAGLNRWLDTNTFPADARKLGLVWRHWTRADVLAVGIVVDDIFGAGGGDEVGNANALNNLATTFGAEQGRAVFDDLRTADDPDATMHVTERFEYPRYSSAVGEPSSGVAAVDADAVALPDAKVSTARATTETPTMSNYIAVSGERSASGHPILVGGPQSSYFYPQLLFEMELSGGGYDSRGVTFPGLGPWVVIGRSRTYAWTATAGGSDLTDQRVERLCEPDGSQPGPTSTHYVFNGACIAMTRPDNDQMTAWRTVHGPVVARTTVQGAPVAIARQRMSRFQTGHAVTAFWKLNQGTVTTAELFAPTLAAVPMSFNWLYVNASDIAYFHSGWYPIRATGVDPDLPSWGTGEWEWKGRLDWHSQPQVINPPSGVAVSWNNKIAPGWRESDNEWSAGTVQRVDLLAERASGLRNATPAQVVSAAQDAATVDVRGELVLPEVLAVLATGPAPSPALSAARDKLAAWSASGAHRRDAADDGWYDDPAVPIMDALFVRLTREIFDPALGSYMKEPVRRPRTIDNPPSQTGGAYAYGWFSMVARDLRRLRGLDPTSDAVGVFCGDGDLATCRALLWESLEAAVVQAGPLPKSSILERIRFIPYIGNASSVRWVNRPTYQQVISFGD